MLSFFQRRTLWWPTLAGWLTLLVLFLGAGLAWWFGGEGFLSRTDRRPTGILVVEGWIGFDGMQAAKAEFDSGRYTHLMTVGTLTDNRWGRRRWSYAELARDELVRLGVPPDRIIAVRVPDFGTHRTFASAVAVHEALAANNFRPAAVNVFTLGVHARRSRLVFAKALTVEVGVVAWRPEVYGNKPWWRSSERASDMIKETVGYLFELLLNSGRLSNSPPAGEASHEAAK